MHRNIRNLLAIAALCSSSLAIAGPVNINTADARTIARELSGVGKAKAELIVAHREAHGPFRSPQELLKIKGIGKKVLERNGDDIRVE